MNKREEEIIKLIKNQTNYDTETIIEKLKQHNGNYLNVIKEYLNPNFKNTKKQQDNISLNQKMMKGYRDFLDNAYMQYQKRKEWNDKVEEYMKQQTNMETDKDIENNTDTDNNEL